MGGVGYRQHLHQFRSLKWAYSLQESWYLHFTWACRFIICFFLTAKDELNQKRIGDMRLFDFSRQHHVYKQMAKCIPGLEADTSNKEEWNEQAVQKHWKADWVSDVEHSLPYDPGYEHWVTNVHGTYTISWCCVYNTGRLPSTWKGRLPPSFCADEQRFLVLLASSLHGR